MDSQGQKEEGGDFLLKEVMKNIKSGSTELFLDGKGVDDTIVSAIVRNQLENPTISILDLRNNKIGDDGAKALINLIEKSKTLTKVFIDGNISKSGVPLINAGYTEKLESELINNKNIIEAKTDYNSYDMSDYSAFAYQKNTLEASCQEHRKEAEKLCGKFWCKGEDGQNVEGIGNLYPEDHYTVRERNAAVNQIRRELGLTGENPIERITRLTNFSGDRASLSR